MSTGEGISKDPAQAAVLLTQVASKGHPWGQVCASSVALPEQTLIEISRMSLLLYKYVLGIMYANGEAGDTDHEKALSLFETSARNGVAAAHNTLGICVSMVPYAALLWTLLIHITCCAGNMYLAGNGVKPDPSKAVDCFRRGVDAGMWGFCVWVAEVHA